MKAEDTFLRLSELTQAIDQALYLNFEQSIWVVAEIGQSQLRKGNMFFELVEQHQNQVEAKMRGQIWRKDVTFLRNKLGEHFALVTSAGNQVLLQVLVNFHPVYGLSLQIMDIDESYTIGQIQLEKERLRQQLIKSGLMQRNKQLEVPKVISRIAVISSISAAGWQDFKQQLLDNLEGFTFDLDLFDTLMQGAKAVADFDVSFDAIAAQDQYDLVCIIRGGGSKLDLATFDQEQVVNLVATSSYPVWTGIGHDIDLSLTDEVAHRHFKTPTALAEGILEHNKVASDELEDIADALHYQIQYVIQEAQNQQEFLVHQLKHELMYQLQVGAQQQTTVKLQLTHAMQTCLATSNYKLEDLRNSMKQLSANQLKLAQFALAQSQIIYDKVNPNGVLRRGYSLIEQNKKIIKQAQDLDPQRPLRILFKDGEVVSINENK